jgi:MerR family transcriptional regulator, light-induced transcriptional regulator
MSEVRMRDSVFAGRDGREGLPTVAALDVALAAIQRLVSQKCVGDVLVKDSFLDRLVAAAISPDPQAIRVLVTEFRQAVILPDRIADDYIPAAARKLGAMWLTDNLSFATVSIGSSRLASLLRDLGQGNGNDLGPGARSSLLVIVPPGENHTLGAMVMASQLRRLGHTVSLQLSPALQDLAAMLDRDDLDGVLISVGQRNSADVCAMLIKTLRSVHKKRLPIVIGGALAEAEPDILAACDADLITNDPGRALAFLGLAIPMPDARAPAQSLGGG